MWVSVYIILFFVWLLSSITAIAVLKWKNSGKLAVLFGFLVNAVSLFIATMMMDKFYGMKEIPGIFSSLGIVVFIVFIPVLTWVNICAMIILKNKSQRKGFYANSRN